MTPKSYYRVVDNITNNSAANIFQFGGQACNPYNSTVF